MKVIWGALLALVVVGSTASAAEPQVSAGGLGPRSILTALTRPDDPDSTWMDPPNLNGLIASSELIGADGVETEVANDFVVGEELDLGRIEWWGGYFNYTPGNPHVQGFNIVLYDDSEGKPNSVIAEWLLPSVTETFVGNQGAFPLYSYAADVDVPLEPDQRYWLSVQADDHVYPPQWGRLAAGAVTGLDSQFRSDYFGFPQWTSCQTVFGQPYDASFGLSLFRKLRGRLVCDDGSPLRIAKATVEFHDNGGLVGSKSVITDIFGRFRTRIPGCSGVHAGAYWSITSPSCTQPWTVPWPSGRCYGNLGTLTCNTCGGCPGTGFASSVTAGVDDNFGGGFDPMSPDLVLNAFMQQCFPGYLAAAGFDDATINRWRLHTFNFPACEVLAANLCFRATALGSDPANDTINLKLINQPGCGGVAPHSAFSTFVKDLPGNGGTWTTGESQLFCLDLANLPGGINLLPLLASGSLEFLSQDDTDFDFVRLDITTCCSPETCPRKYFSTQIAGTKDNYVGSEAAQPSAALSNWMATCAPTHPPLRNFDQTGSDRWFAQSFNLCNTCSTGVQSAKLCIKLRSESSLYTTDYICLGLPGSCTGTWAWGRHLMDLIPGWNGTDRTICLDLSALPTATGTVNILPLLTTGSLDILTQDDCNIDYMELETACCCPPCPQPLQYQLLAGAFDNFVTPDPASPDAGLTSWIASCWGVSLANFDQIPGEGSVPANAWIAHTFTFTPPTRAFLSVRVRGTTGLGSGGTFNDIIALELLDPTSCPATWAGWGSAIRLLPGAGGTWNAGQTATFLLDLSALPTATGPINLLPFLADGQLRLIVADDTGVDFAQLYLESCIAPADVIESAVSGGAFLQLSQNMPNPFQPQTQISFSLPQACQTELEILDVTGRVVRRLVSSPLDAGPHVVVWDGRNDEDRRAASGIYFYRLRAAGQATARKMILMD